MTLSEYRDPWQAQVDPGLPHPRDKDLLAWIVERSAEFDRRIRRRDLTEAVVAAGMVLLFGYELLTTESWLGRLGAGVLMAAAVFVVWRMRRARLTGRSTDLDRSVVARLRAQRRRVVAQTRLLETVMHWYLVPLGAGVALFAFGQDVAAWHSGLVVLAMVALYALIWRLNQRVVRHDLRPRRDRLDRILAQIDEPADGTRR